MSKCVWELFDDKVMVSLYSTQEPHAQDWLFALFDHLKHDELIRVLVLLLSNIAPSKEGDA